MCVLLHMDLSREYDCVCGFGFVRGEDMDLCLGEDMNVCRLLVGIWLSLNSTQIKPQINHLYTQ